jgi:DNA-binding NarL/FixJ family response regulator
MIKVMLVDDHPIVLSELSALVQFDDALPRLAALSGLRLAVARWAVR